MRERDFGEESEAAIFEPDRICSFHLAKNREILVKCGIERGEKYTSGEIIEII